MIKPGRFAVQEDTAPEPKAVALMREDMRQLAIERQKFADGNTELFLARKQAIEQALADAEALKKLAADKNAEADKKLSTINAIQESLTAEKDEFYKASKARAVELTQKHASLLDLEAVLNKKQADLNVREQQIVEGEEKLSISLEQYGKDLAILQDGKLKLLEDIKNLEDDRQLVENKSAEVENTIKRIENDKVATFALKDQAEKAIEYYTEKANDCELVLKGIDEVKRKVNDDAAINKIQARNLSDKIEKLKAQESRLNAKEAELNDLKSSILQKEA